MAEIDTSSYPKPTAQPSLMDQVAKYGGVAIQKQQFDQNKMDQANQALGYMVRAMGSLGPNATKQDYARAAQNAVDQGLVPQQQENVFMQRLQASPSPKAFYDEFMNAAASHQEQLDYHLGRPGVLNTGNSQVPITTSQRYGVQSTGAPIQSQLPVGTPGYDASGNPAFAGPGQGVAAPPPSPNVGNAPPLPVARPTPKTTGPTGPTVDITNQRQGEGTFDQMYQNRGLAPSPGAMFEEGKKALAADQLMAASKATAIKPAIAALKILPGLRTGPGTEPYNKAVAFLKTWSEDPDKIDPNNKTVLYQEANKLLSQYAMKQGDRSDAAQEAAYKSFPNIGTQLNPTAIKVLRDQIARDRIEIARPNAFLAKETNPSNYGKHQASFPQSQDERAYGADLMPEEERNKLVQEMVNRYKKNPKDKEANQFLQSLDMARQQF